MAFTSLKNKVAELKNKAIAFKQMLFPNNPGEQAGSELWETIKAFGKTCWSGLKLSGAMCKTAWNFSKQVYHSYQAKRASDKQDLNTARAYEEEAKRDSNEVWAGAEWAKNEALEMASQGLRTVGHTGETLWYGSTAAASTIGDGLWSIGSGMGSTIISDAHSYIGGQASHDVHLIDFSEPADAAQAEAAQLVALPTPPVSVDALQALAAQAEALVQPMLAQASEIPDPKEHSEQHAHEMLVKFEQVKEQGKHSSINPSSKMEREDFEIAAAAQLHKRQPGAAAA